MIRKKRKAKNPIPTKDQKILWAKAAGLCSMPNCRIPLTLTDNNDQAVTLGEMCHIVGEKKSKGSPRSSSPMAMKQRNTYTNLILLCTNHHTLIDKNEGAWPIEKLHSVKDEHELWVSQSLSQKRLSADELIYSSLIDELTNILQLDYWEWFCDNAVRHLIHKDFIRAYEIILERKVTIIWPKKYKNVKNAIENLIESYIQYVEQYLENAYLGDHNEFYRIDKEYKKTFPNPNYSYYAERENHWSTLNFLFLCSYCIKVNEYAEAVRKYFNPLYYCVKGRFIIKDDFGYHLGVSGAILDPTSIKIQPLIKKHQKLYRKFIKVTPMSNLPIKV